MIITSGGDASWPGPDEMGAWKTINYHDRPDWGAEALALTGRVGVDLVVETGSEARSAQSVKLHPGGRHDRPDRCAHRRHHRSDRDHAPLDHAARHHVGSQPSFPRDECRDRGQ
ncbi:MAG: hypothetical protein R3E68_22075 [Burkholderiaceae bacterium]